MWQEHSIENCKVCNLYNVQSKGGVPKKKERRGRIKLLFDIESKDIFLNKLDQSVVDCKLENCELAQWLCKLKAKFTCGVCKNILSLRSVTTKCNYFCSVCLSDMFKRNRQNDIKCPICNKNVNFKDIEGTDMAFRSILSDLMVK